MSYIGYIGSLSYIGYLCVGVWLGANVTGDKHDHQHIPILVIQVLAFGFTNIVCMANGLVPHLLLRAPLGVIMRFPLPSSRIHCTPHQAGLHGMAWFTWDAIPHH